MDDKADAVSGKARLKVCHIITKLELGGAQRNTLYTVAHLDKERFDVSLVCGRGGMLDGEATESCRNTVFSRHLVRQISPWHDAAAITELRSILRRLGPDIVHTHSSKAGIIGRIAAKAAGVPHIIHTFHGFGFNSEQPWPVRTAYINAEKLCAAFSEKLIFVSRANMDEARALGIGKPEGYRLIRSGIRLDKYRGEKPDRAGVRREMGFEENCPLALCVGNMKPQKNPLEFVRIAAETARRVPSARFIFTGDGPLRPQAESLALELGLKGKIAFPGWREDTARLMAAADLYMLASLWEGLPRSIVEALACGLPCAAYATDGVSDILRDGENGFVFARKDSAGLASKAAAVLSDAELRTRLAKNAAGTDLREFDIDYMVAQQERLYMETACISA